MEAHTSHWATFINLFMLNYAYLCIHSAFIEFVQAVKICKLQQNESYHVPVNQFKSYTTLTE